MHETHRFTSFIPPKTKYLILGSFTAKDSKKDVDYDWYYSNGRNQFWKIIEGVYGVKLSDLESKQRLFKSLSIGVTDIILECDRVKFNSLDSSLKNIVFNTHTIQEAFEQNKIEQVLFTSRYVETLYKRHFKNQIEAFPKIKLVTLPSPSPRYAKISIDEKIMIYKNLLPKSIKNR